MAPSPRCRSSRRAGPPIRSARPSSTRSELDAAWARRGKTEIRVGSTRTVDSACASDFAEGAGGAHDDAGRRAGDAGAGDAGAAGRGACPAHGSGFAARAGGLGVTRERHDERGATTPWYLTSGIFGGGSKAASRVAEDRTRPDQSCKGVLFELLNEMDGLGEDADVLFLLTTNRPDILEPALASRPGRVDLTIEVPLPDGEGRRRMFELYGRGLTLKGVDVPRWIARTEGASGAFIRELLRKAAVFAAEEGQEIVVEDRHLDDAIRELVLCGGGLTKSLLAAQKMIE
ncbi:AAA family ATPase [Sorangium sp. So ce764]